MSPPNQNDPYGGFRRGEHTITGRFKSQGMDWDDLRDSFFNKSDILGFFEEMERRQMEAEPLRRLDHLLGQFGPSILFTLVMDTLNEMGDLENVLDIIEPMAHHVMQARRHMEVHERRSRRDPFFGVDATRIDSIEAGKMQISRELNAMDYRDSDIFQDQIRRKRTRPR